MVGNKKLTLLVFSLFFIINIASSGGHFDVSDGIEYFLVTESMALKHSAKLYPDVPSVHQLHFDVSNTLNTNSYFQGIPYLHSNPRPIYIEHCCLLSAIAVPFYYAAMFFSVSPVATVAIFVNPIILALISVIIFRFSLEIYRSRKVAFLASLIFGVTSFAWPYVTTLFPQPLETLLLISSAFFIYISVTKINSSTFDSSNLKNKGIFFAGLGGLFLGLSVFAHPTSIIVFPGFLVYSIFSMRSNGKNLSAFLLVLAIVIFFAGLVNYWRFGSFIDFGYGSFGGLGIHHGWQGLVGLLISPGFGLIFFFPIAVLFPIAIIHMNKQNRGLSLLFAYVVFINWMYFGTLYDPKFGAGVWDGLAWGPRYLLVILPFLSVASGALLHDLKVASRRILKVSIIALCAVGFGVNLLGVLVWEMYGLGYGWSRDQLWKDPMGINMTWNPDYSQIGLHFNVLASSYLTVLSTALAHHQVPWNNWEYRGLWQCSYDLYIYCKFGLLPVLFLSGIIIALSILIVAEIGNESNTKYFLLRMKRCFQPKRT